MNKERIQKLKAMKDVDLLKEKKSLLASILALRVDIANHKTSGIHKFKVMKRDIARINTFLSMRKEIND